MASEVDTAMPRIDLNPGSTLTVSVGDPGATVSLLAVHGWAEVAPPESKLTPNGGAYLPGDV